MIKQEKLGKYYELFKERFIKYFLATEGSNIESRKKQRRLAYLVLFGLIILLSMIFSFDGTKEEKLQEEKPKEEGIEVNKLTNGASLEDSWMKTKGQEIKGVEAMQKIAEQKQDHKTAELEKNKISREELDRLLNERDKQAEDRYNRQLEELTKQILENTEKAKNEMSSMGYAKVKKKKILEFGKYIPANSYVEAEVITGADVGTGVSSAADPKSIKMRITGDVISAAEVGKKELRNKALIGCLVSATAKGNISSEKGEFSTVLMTCVKKGKQIIEVPVKGYLSQGNKEGIRGEVKSKEGDAVFNAFVSGTIGGIGSGISKSVAPSLQLKGGTLSGDKQSVKDIFKGGMSDGIAASSDLLSEYWIRKAEQYQPIIEIGNNIQVDIHFQEGFSLEDDNDEK